MTMIVIDDAEDFVALHQPAGTVVMARSGAKGGPRNKQTLPGGWDGGYVRRIWERDAVRAHDAMHGYSVVRKWDWTMNEFRGWYVNLEVPWRRSFVGFDTGDLILDLVVSDDLTSWRWKDEDEQQWALSMGLIDEAAADEARRQGERAILDLTQRRRLFDHRRWEAWRPNRPSTPPQLPLDWLLL